MKKLEDIPKKEVFNVPEGYFDKLPGIIQARVAKPEKERSPVWGFALRYALPTVVLLAVGIVWFNQTHKVVDAEQLLSSIQTEDLVAYLNDSDITTDELLAEVEWSDDDAKEIEGNVYDLNLEGESLDDIVSEMELDNF
jgi:hypothetical protein